MTEKKKGRPLKEAPSNNDALAPLAGEVESEAPQFSALQDTAYGLSKLPNGQYALVRIKYDAVSGRMIEPEVSLVGEDLYEAEERLRIVLSSELFRW